MEEARLPPRETVRRESTVSALALTVRRCDLCVAIVLPPLVLANEGVALAVRMLPCPSDDCKSASEGARNE